MCVHLSESVRDRPGHPLQRAARETASMESPPGHYARRNDASLAFQVAGSGVGLLLMAGGSGTSVAWADPTASQFFRELSRFTRLVTFEQRGAGMSDPLDQ